MMLWRAGLNCRPIMHGRNLQQQFIKLRINDKQRSVLRMPRAVSLANLSKLYRRNLQPQNIMISRVSVEMSTWKWLHHTNQNMLCNIKKECTSPDRQSQEMQDTMLSKCKNNGSYFFLGKNGPAAGSRPSEESSPMCSCRWWRAILWSIGSVASGRFLAWF